MLLGCKTNLVLLLICSEALTNVLCYSNAQHKKQSQKLFVLLVSRTFFCYSCSGLQLSELWHTQMVFSPLHFSAFRPSCRWLTKKCWHPSCSSWLGRGWPTPCSTDRSRRAWSSSPGFLQHCALGSKLW